MNKNCDSAHPGIREDKDGTFTIDCVKCVRGHRVHIYSSGYLNLEDAIEAMPLVIEGRMEEAKKKYAHELLFSEFMEKYEEYRLIHVRHSTVAFAKSVRKTYLSAWEALSVEQAFSRDKVKAVYDELLTHQGVPSWKNRCFGALRQMAETAFKWKLLSASSYQDALSILENIPESRGKKEERSVWSKKERETFLSKIEDPESKTLFTLYIALGARIGEFAGLTWDCFDPKSGYIEIKQQLVYEGVGKWVLSPLLKTSESYRLCKLPKKVVEMLEEHKAKGKGEGFIFTSKGDNPLSKTSIRRKMYGYAKKAGLKKITPHAFRHGKAMELMKVCKNMQEVKSAARYLGHSATMMIDTYGHGEKAATEAVLRRLEKEE